MYILHYRTKSLEINIKRCSSMNSAAKDKTQGGRNNLSICCDFLTVSRIPLCWIPAGIFTLSWLISERHIVEPVLDKPAFYVPNVSKLSSPRPVLPTFCREKMSAGGEKCHNLCPAGLDYPTSEAYPPAAPVSHYKSSPYWTSGQTGVWFIGWMLLPGSRRSLLSVLQ